jgi:8-oxo-dGTP pyrophosphatase MutT (NUDIX family)
VTIVKFFDQDYIPDGRLTYSVIVARYGGRWMFVRHHDRATWEIAGGHIEENETPSYTARRELTEERNMVLKQKRYRDLCRAYACERRDRRADLLSGRLSLQLFSDYLCDKYTLIH